MKKRKCVWKGGGNLKREKMDEEKSRKKMILEKLSEASEKNTKKRENGRRGERQ